MEYGITCNNKYGFLSDEEAEDPEILLKKAIQKKDLKEKEEKKIAEEKAAAAAAELASAEQKRVANKENRRDNAERGRGAPRGRGGPRGDGPRRPRDGPKPQGEEGTRSARGAPRGGLNRPRRERPVKEGEAGQENAVSGGDEARLSDDNENRRGPRGPRVFRRGGPRVPGVRLDRKSGSDQTGVKPVEKKEGHGKGNWGTEQDELAAAEDVNASSGGEVEREKTEEDLKREAELERAARELTLSEFKARMAEKVDRAEFNIRKAGEGVDTKNMPKLVPLQRDDEDDHTTEEVVIVRREPKAKKLNIEVTFGDENRPNRGGRGGFRGAPRGAVRHVKDNRRGKEAHFDFSADAFPALGGGR
uniref:HABP4_PAI-RBP1 domain-containing protein n=1 Tax=Steinernema glaseri TaxID=37863 RepID=A0A1I7ZRR6_9BILA